MTRRHFTAAKSTMHAAIHPTSMLPRQLSSLWVTGLLLSVPPALEAAKVQFERTKPHVTIAVAGHVEHQDPALSFEIVMDVEFGRNRPASGGVQILLGDASVRSYEPVGGALLEGKQCLVFFLGSAPSGELDPTDPAIAIVRENPARPGLVSVELHASRHSPRLFDAALSGTVQVAETGRRVQQVPPRWFLSRHPPQRVTIHGTDLEAGFFSRLSVRRDHHARGLVALGLLDGGPAVCFEPVFGTVVPATESGPAVIVILMALQRAPLRIENLAVATVRPNQHVPGCDIWDFSSNGVADSSGSPLHLVFDAEGTTRFVPAPTPRDLTADRSR